ncbi:MAG: dihydroneopterin aldolase [Prevotella sp.]|nr:dihydroneopterin aldolase [Prevotella sp.]MDD3387049.1 dihydroneopterin aldolase [Prevotella sp.]MDD4533804.1 dihydroneopterin aldolase [Prevotella sp.]
MSMLKDSYIYLNCLRFHAYHGVEAQERLTGNDYELDLRLNVDVSAATMSDRVEDTVNYAEVYRLIEAEMAKPSNLLEHVAGRIGQALIEKWPQIQSVDIRLTKQNPPMGADCKGAGVELHLINDKT